MEILMSDKKQMQLLIDQFDSFGFYLDSKLDRDIEENRKGAFSLSFTDENGNPLQNVKLKIKQTSHEFKFGCNTFYLDQFEDEERRKAYREKFAHLFNFAVVPLYWDTLEPEEGNPRFGEDSVHVHRRPPVDTIVKFCEENKIRMKGHCLIYNSFQPDWISEDSREIKIKIDRRLKAIAERYPDKFVDVDVINEMFRIYKNCYKGFGCRNLQLTDEPDHEKWAFDLCKKYFPYSTLYWNEGMHETLGESQYSGFRSYYYMALKENLAKGAPIEGIGVQYHANGDPNKLFRQVHHSCHPLRQLDAFERYGDFGLPISISEISIPSFGHDPEDEELQAELAKRLFKLWFGRKHVDSIVWWNLADNTAFGDENLFHSGLIRNDCSEKPVYRVLDELINKEWRTNLTAEANGSFSFMGFYGDYEVEATHEGKTVTKTVRLYKDNTGYDNRRMNFRTKNIVI